MSDSKLAALHEAIDEVVRRSAAISGYSPQGGDEIRPDFIVDLDTHIKSLEESVSAVRVILDAVMRG